MKEGGYQGWPPDFCLERTFEWVECRCMQMGTAFSYPNVFFSGYFPPWSPAYVAQLAGYLEALCSLRRVNFWLRVQGFSNVGQCLCSL